MIACQELSMEEIFVDVKKCEPKNRVRGANVSIPAEYVAVVYLKKSGTVAAPVALGSSAVYWGSSEALIWDSDWMTKPRL